jgi:hypothetical protein
MCACASTDLNSRVLYAVRHAQAPGAGRRGPRSTLSAESTPLLESKAALNRFHPRENPFKEMLNNLGQGGELPLELQGKLLRAERQKRSG